MNVFVLCTGRTGSVSFTKACQHIDNFSASHESRVKFLGEERLNFPNNHIEVDNRLSWFLGKLGAKYGEKAFYVHLLRNEEATAASFMQRWALPGSIIKGYTDAILMSKGEKGEAYCLDYVNTVNTNISYFLRDKPLQMRIHLEDIKGGFSTFWNEIGAEGDLDAALSEFNKQYNSSKQAPTLFSKIKRLIKS